MTDEKSRRTVDTDLLGRLESFGENDDPLRTVLKADERVIARVTDGIYRQPGSALRELISNAYDADAKLVRIQTDRPRFSRIVVEDDGNGMSAATVLHLLHHIGGSAKRDVAGIALGVTDDNDPNRSPGGRELIGKIGIGLFSVAQLTQSFELITKVKGESQRTIAKVILRRYSDDAFRSVEANGEYEAGKVLIWRESAADLESHGTSIILDSIWPQTRDTLQSASRWDAIRNVGTDDTPIVNRPEPPTFHIGVVSKTDSNVYDSPSRLPWSDGDKPPAAFEKLVTRISNPAGREIQNPALEKLLDNYLQMIWDLSLWCPLRYADIHPFDLPLSDKQIVYSVDNTTKPLQLVKSTESLRRALHLGDSVHDSDFRVIIDDLELARPIKIRNFVETSSAFQTPIIVAGTARQNFSGAAVEMSGGPIEFQAYFVWAPQIRPPDHRGVLVRVHNATGMLFDQTFIDFPVAEQRRLSQITCEIFIIEGFDGALNIDRESFNFAHPHAVYLTRWLHASLRKLIAAQKRLAASALDDRQKANVDATRTASKELVEAIWARESDGDGTIPPNYRFTGTGTGTETDSVVASVGLPPELTYAKEAIFAEARGRGRAARDEKWQLLIGSIAQVLAAYGIFDNLDQARQEMLLKELRRLIDESRLDLR